MQPIAIAVFGLGRWGVHLLRNFLAHPQARVVAIVDPNADRLAAVGDRLNRLDVLPFTNWQQAMQHPEVEAVAIATPASWHEPLIRAALRQGHHVLAEKPLTLNAETAIALCQLAEQQQRQLVVDHTYLFHPAVQCAQTHLPQLGRLRYGYATRTHSHPIRQDVDVLWDLAIHDLSIFNFWLNDRPTRVQGQGQSWRSSGSSAIDLAWIKLEYASGFVAALHLCWCNPDRQRRISIVGDRGALTFDELQPSSLWWQPIEAEQVAIEPEAIEPLWQVCDHFLACVQHNRLSGRSSGWVGADLVQILAAISRSIDQQGAWVQIDRR